MIQPNKDSLRKFLEIFETLNAFEANQRIIRGYGAFREEDCPMPEAVEVLQWLRFLSEK